MRVSIDRAIAREYGDPRHGELRQAVIQSYEHNVLLMLVLRDGTRLTGRIGQQDDATFRLMDLQGRSHTVSYAQVANLSTTTVVKVAAAVAIAVLVGVLWKNCLYRC
jgi:CBS-domain-containing membrane protein